MAVPGRVASRLAAGLKKFQPIIAAAKSRDVNESDTVVIVTDMLHEIFGYDKYSEITSEHAIRGTYCDLAIKLDGVVQLLVEVKAINLDLKESFTKQAVDYAANQGAEWVILTNGIRWHAYRVTFTKPIGQELVLDLNIQESSARNEDHIERLWLLAKEGWQKAGLSEYQAQRQALSRFLLGAVVLSEPILEVVRRELKRLSPGVKIEIAEIKAALSQEVIKREVIDGEKADEARKQLSRASNRALRIKTARDSTKMVEATTNSGEPVPDKTDPERLES